MTDRETENGDELMEAVRHMNAVGECLQTLRAAVERLDAIRKRTATFTEIQLCYFDVENAARELVRVVDRR